MNLFKKCLALIIVICGIAGAEDLTDRKMLWAHYVPWHTPENDSLTPGWYVSHPVSDVEGDVYKNEIKRAIAQGIDGFLMDVVVRYGSTSFADIRKFLKAAEGTSFYCAICLDVKTTVSNQIAEVKKMMSINASHPNYPKIKGKPLVATYTWHDWTPDEWRQIKEGLEREGCPVYLVANLGLGQKRYSEELLREYAEVFDAGYYFGYGARGPSSPRKNEIALQICNEKGRLFMPAIGPGYFGGWLHGRNDFYQPFRGIDIIQNKFESAISLPEVNWLHLTTWNDYDETTLLPLRLSPGCFSLIRSYAEDWKNLPHPKNPDVIFAYHREEFSGTMLRFEAMRLPSKDKSPVVVGGRLRDKNGKIVALLELKTLTNDYDRVEWLLSSTKLAASPVLTPEFAMRGKSVAEKAVFPSMHLVRGWLECPETVRVTFSNLRDLEHTLKISYEEGILESEMSFESTEKIKRVVLYRNDRPLAQFAPGDSSVQMPVFVQGAGNWSVSVENGEMKEAIRLSCPVTAKGNFQKTSSTVKSYKTPKWARCAVRADGGKNMQFIFTGNKERMEITPEEFASKRRVTLGGIDFFMTGDLTLYNRKPWNEKKGSARLKLFERPPCKSDFFFLRFEYYDGKASETPPIWPFASGKTVFEDTLVETFVTLERSSGGSGRKGDREFLTPQGDWPVKETRLVKVPVSSLSVRKASWPMGGKDGKDTLALGMNEYGDRYIKGARLPLRMWPSGPAMVSFDILPDECGEEKQVIIRRHGWMDGISSVSITGDGFLEASYGDHETLLTVTGKKKVYAGQWTHVKVVFDGITLSIYHNGLKDASESLSSPVRCYGNVTAYIGDKKGIKPFKGRIVNLKVTGKCEKNNIR